MQCFWELPAVAHFCSLFRSAFKLGDFDIEDLEEAFISDSATEDSRSTLIIDLLINLLKGLIGRRDITLVNDLILMPYNFICCLERRPKRSID